MFDRHTYRGKALRNCDLFKKGDWIQGNVLYREDAVRIILGVAYKRGGGFEADARLVDPATLGQCTGRRDNKRQLIFEGDILQDKDGATFIMEWINGSSTFCFHYPEAYCWPCETHLEGVVVGNIHDNPELLEVNGDA